MSSNVFNSQGYAVASRVLDIPLISSCAEAMPELLNNNAYSKKALYLRSVFEKSPEKFSEDVSLQDIPKDEVFIWPSPLGLSGCFRELVSNERIWDFGAECLGASSDSLVLNYVQVITKPSRIGPRVNWHRDYGNKHISTVRSSDMIRLLIPLQSYQEYSGVTEVVPGSHQVGDAEALEKCAIELVASRESGLNVKVGCGDILAIHSKTIHGSAINKSMYSRNQLVVQLAVGSAEYRTNIESSSTEPYHMSERPEICA